MKKKKKGTPVIPPHQHYQQQHYQQQHYQQQQYDDDDYDYDDDDRKDEPGGRIVRKIASFLTLSDCASLAPVASYSSLLSTPDTPGLMALTPIIDQQQQQQHQQQQQQQQQQQDQILDKRLQDRRRKYLTQKLAAAVFAHPHSLRSFCLQAHQAATNIQTSKQNNVNNNNVNNNKPPPTFTIFDFILKSFLQHTPLSVALHLLDALVQLTLDTTFASFTLTTNTLATLVHKLAHFVANVCDTLRSSQQSGMGSAALLHRLSRGDLTAMSATTLSAPSLSATTILNSSSSAATTHANSAAATTAAAAATTTAAAATATQTIEDQKLLQKLSRINAAGHVISYHEGDEEALTRHAKKRVQRMMHYEINLRPFVATVVLPPQQNGDHNDHDNDGGADTPFLCTPQSFPPTPASRNIVMARGSRFAEDVVFLARDKLRLEGSLDSSNERTRAMAQALREASRLAVFNAADLGNGVALMCGQHVAQKVGNVLYCSIRSMVPVLRNCFAYFEMTVVPRHNNSTTTSLLPMATVNIGLSTLEMPVNTLVGAWKGSVGLCTTGQMLAAGQWCSPIDPTLNMYSEGDTVGCLVCLDDGSAFETWDGVMVTASVTFNVNGVIVSPPISMGGTGEELVVPPSSTLPLLVPMEEELFPTVTLHSPATRVMCRFSSEDIVATTRARIGAPRGVPVYTIDGSVLFEEDQDETNRYFVDKHGGGGDDDEANENGNDSNNNTHDYAAGDVENEATSLLLSSSSSSSSPESCC